jgi:hypothetical protein
MINFNNNINIMREELYNVNIKLEKLLESGNYSQLKYKLNADGFMKWKDDKYQDYWFNIKNAFEQGVTPTNDYDNPFFKSLNNLGVRGRLELLFNKSNTTTHTSNFSANQDYTSQVSEGLEGFKAIHKDIEETIFNDVAKYFNEVLHHEVLRNINGKWSLVIDNETLWDIWSNIIYPYIQSNPSTMISVASFYFLSGLLIKRSISKINSKILERIREDYKKEMSNPATKKDILEFKHLCESQNKVLFWMNSIEMILVCGFTYALAPKIKPSFPPITIPLPQNPDYNSYTNPGYNTYTNPNFYNSPHHYPYSNSFLLPFLTNKISKRFQTILKYILLFIFIIFIIYILPYIDFITNSPHLIYLFIIIISSIVIFYLFLNGFIILNYSIWSQTDKNKDKELYKYLPKFIKNYLLNLKEISQYKSSNYFIKLYFMSGTILLLMLIIFIITIIVL